MTAEQHLSGYGVTMAEAYSFIISNLNNLSTILNVCQTFGVTTDMIGEVLTEGGLSVNGQLVANHFASNGLDASVLGGTTASIDVVTPELSSLASVLAGKTLYTGIWGTPETLESWTFNADASEYVMTELYGADSLSVDTFQVTVTDSSIEAFAGDESDSILQLIEITDTYISFAFNGEGFPQDDTRIYFDQAEAEQYFSLTSDWLAGNTFYLAWFGNVEEGAPASEDAWEVDELIYSEDGTLTVNNLLTSESMETVFGVTSDGRIYTDGNPSEGNEITLAGDSYFVTNFMVGTEVDNTEWFFYDRQDALDFASGTLLL